MAKIMILEVSGGRGDYRVEPFKRIVSVQDEVDFLGTMRLNVLKELMAAVRDGSLTELEQAGILHSIKTRLTDTGLTEYPDTPEAEAALYRKYAEEEILV
jgi:hypothetical protein